MRDATITQTGKTSDGRGGRTEAATGDPHACRALVTKYSDYSRNSSDGRIEHTDRRATVIALSLDIVPKIGDVFEQSGVSWRIKDVSQDPAGATFVLQICPTKAA